MVKKWLLTYCQKYCYTPSATASLKALIGVVRRIKCGEERPACIKCTSTGRICDGYSGLGIEPWTQPDLMPAWEATIAPTPFRGKESRSLLFFRERTVHQLNSFFPNHFWSDIVPQIAQTEPSVRHALVAFSGFHERFVRGSIPVDEHFGFKQYNLAIRQLLECRSSQISQLIGLLCCLLFVSIEVGWAQNIQLLSPNFYVVTTEQAYLRNHFAKEWQEDPESITKGPLETYLRQQHKLTGAFCFAGTTFHASRFSSHFGMSFSTKRTPPCVYYLCTEYMVREDTLCC